MGEFWPHVRVAVTHDEYEWNAAHRIHAAIYYIIQDVLLMLAKIQFGTAGRSVYFKID